MPERPPPGRDETGAGFDAEPSAGAAAGSPRRGTREPGLDAGAVLAFDFGLKRIGVALGTLLENGRGGSARPLATIDGEANDARFAAIAALIAEWQPVRLLVGRPLNDDGTPHEMTARCARFASQLRGRFGVPVDQVDERFSSSEAEASLRELGLPWRQRKARIDAEAARVILESWFAANARPAHATA